MWTGIFRWYVHIPFDEERSDLTRYKFSKIEKTKHFWLICWQKSQATIRRKIFPMWKTPFRHMQHFYRKDSPFLIPFLLSIRHWTHIYLSGKYAKILFKFMQVATGTWLHGNLSMGVIRQNNSSESCTSATGEENIFFSHFIRWSI